MEEMEVKKIKGQGNVGNHLSIVKDNVVSSASEMLEISGVTWVNGYLKHRG